MRKYFYYYLIYITLLLVAVLLIQCNYPGLSDDEIKEINGESGTPESPTPPLISSTYTANSISFDMITVPGGATMLNSSNVTLSDFNIGKTEVTQQLWQAVMGSNPSDFSGSNKPVECVSWNDIVGIGSTTGYTINGVTYKTDGFCYKLSQLAVGGKQFRLPTEAEWEYAAKGGQQTHNYTYSGSNTINDVAWYYSNSGNITHEVGTKAANELGIYDMSGNVWEWCSDWYGSTYPSSTNNPIGATSGFYRVLHGGSWNDLAAYCRSSNRDNAAPSAFGDDCGFRLASSIY